RLVREPLELLAIEAAAAEVAEEDAADAAEHAERREHRLDEREAELGVEERRLAAHELEVVVAAHLGVAAEVEEVGRAAPALEPAAPQRQQPGRADALVEAQVDVGRLPIERVADLWRDLVAQAHGVARQRPELAEHRRL